MTSRPIQTDGESFAKVPATRELAVRLFEIDLVFDCMLREFCFLSITDKETEVSGGEVNCSRSHSFKCRPHLHCGIKTMD